jgi:8-oxo-dGTP pyrophosphatase MutT (NUDIX family)
MSDLSQIVAPLELQADEQAEWPPVQLRVRTYLTTTLPPLDLVSSVRALVRKGDQILVVRDPVSVHILPGGRREPGETLMQTLEREVLEETGWSIRDARLIGLAHFQHLTPKPAEYRYPYPDFLHLVYVATADRYDAGKREIDGYELETGFQPLTTVKEGPGTLLPTLPSAGSSPGSRALPGAASLSPPSAGCAAPPRRRRWH